jgi:hypothetical protein
MTTPNTNLIRRLAYMLDACLPYLQKREDAEKRRELGKPIRRITARERNTAAKIAVKEAFDLLGIEAGK